MTQAEREHRAARDAIVNRPEQERTATLATYARVFGRDAVLRDQHGYLSASPLQRAKGASQTAKQARAEAKLLRSLTPDEAVERIEQTRAERAAREARRVERERNHVHDVGQGQRSTTRGNGSTLGL